MVKVSTLTQLIDANSVLTALEEGTDSVSQVTSLRVSPLPSGAFRGEPFSLAAEIVTDPPVVSITAQWKHGTSPRTIPEIKITCTNASTGDAESVELSRVIPSDGVVQNTVSQLVQLVRQ